MPFLYDTFTAANGTLITSRSPNVGPSWSHWDFGGSNATTGVILGNAAGNSGSADSSGNTRIISASDAPSTDYALTGTITVVSATRSTGLMIRCQSGAYTGYLAFVADTGVLTLYRINDGSLTSLGTWNFTWSAGESHELGIAAVGAGASVTLSVKVDGVQRISVSDTSADRITSAGRPGLWLSGGTQYRVDALSAVDIAASAITVTPPSDMRVYQRSSAQATVSLFGTYTGAPSAIQARVVLDGTSTEVVGWTTIDAAPVGSTYSGSIIVPEGGWYNVEVRQSPSTELTAASANKFGVGALYCIAGQSNAMQWLTVGTGTPTGATAKHAGSGAWATNTGSGGIAFANAMASALGVPVGLVGTAADGAALTAAGDRGSGYWLNTSGAPWAAWLSAMADVGGKLEGLLWLQGESDALQGVSGTAYSAGLTTLFASMRSQLGQASLPIFMAPLCRSSHADSTDAEWNAINDAFTSYSASNVTLACDTWDLPQADSLHYSATGYATLAERFALAVRASKGAAVHSRGPAIVGGSRNTTTADIVVSHAGGTDIAPATGVTGFRFVDNGTPVTPTSIVRLNATTFRATFGADLVGPLYVSAAWGQQPSVTDPARDDDGLPVRRTLSAGVFLSGAKLDMAVYPAGETPTWSLGAGWSGTPIYTDSETAPTDSTPHVFTPDASGLSAGTPFRVWLVWVDGEAVVGPTASAEWATSAASVSLTIQDASHAHAADSLALSYNLTISVADGQHAHVADAPSLTADLALIIADAIHAHAAEGVSLDTSVALAVQDALHAHNADNLTLSAALALAVQDAVHGQQADNVTLSADQALIVQGAVHAHQADNISINSGLSVEPADATHSHAAEVVALSAALSLLVDSAIHGHLSDNLTLSSDASANLAVQDASHAHSATQAVLSAALALLVQDATHGHQADNLALSVDLALAVQSSAHAHLADSVDLYEGLSISIQDAFHAHAAGSLSLDTALSLAVQDALHVHSAEAANLTTLVNLIVDSAVHAHFAGNVLLKLQASEEDIAALRRSVFATLARQALFVTVPGSLN